HASTRSGSRTIGVRESVPASAWSRRRSSLSMRWTSWPRAEKRMAVGQPRYPSPPRITMRIGASGGGVRDPSYPEARCGRSAREVLERLEHAVDLRDRVVVAEADPHRTARLEEPQAVEHLDRVVVPVPREDAAFRERRRRIARMAVAHPDRARR